MTERPTTTLHGRGVWTQHITLLDSAALASADASAIAELVRATCTRERGRPVYAVEDRLYYEQMAGDYRAASEMADSVNHAISVDRDNAVDAVLRLPIEGSPRAYLEAVGEALDTVAKAEGQYTARVLAGLLHDITQAVTTRLASAPAPR